MYERWARVYDAIYSFKDYEAEAERVLGIVRRHAPGGRSLLDVACGTGRHIEYLKEKLHVEGLDASRELLSIARARNPGVTLHEGDMVTTDLGRRFDIVTCLFSSIGHMKTTDGLRAALSNMAHHLEAGGILVLEPWLAPDVWEDGHLSATFVDDPDLKVARIERSERRGNLSILNMDFVVGTPDGSEHFSETIELGLFTDDEYTDAVSSAGLEIVEHDPDGFMGRGLYMARRR